jgi:hypothetical protein
MLTRPLTTEAMVPTQPSESLVPATATGKVILDISMLTSPTLAVVGPATQPSHPPPSVMCAPIPVGTAAEAPQGTPRGLSSTIRSASPSVEDRRSLTLATLPQREVVGLTRLQTTPSVPPRSLQTMPACALLPMSTHICLWAARGPRRRHASAPCHSDVMPRAAPRWGY